MKRLVSARVGNPETTKRFSVGETSPTLKVPNRTGRNEGAEGAAGSSLTARRRKLRSLCLAQSLRFSPFQFVLAMLGRFGGIGPRLEIRFLDKVAPAFVPI
jgi:hypothetical protein